MGLLQGLFGFGAGVFQSLRVAADGVLGVLQAGVQRAQVGDGGVDGRHGRVVRCHGCHLVAHGGVGALQALHVITGGLQHGLRRSRVILHGGKSLVHRLGYSIVAVVGVLQGLISRIGGVGEGLLRAVQRIAGLVYQWRCGVGCLPRFVQHGRGGVHQRGSGLHEVGVGGGLIGGGAHLGHRAVDTRDQGAPIGENALATHERCERRSGIERHRRHGFRERLVDGLLQGGRAR